VASAGLSWPLPAEMTETALETALFAAAGTKHGHRRHVEPDWAEIHRELKRKHVTLTMLWDEYIERCPEGYRYSRFCELYRSWASRLSVTMRQAHIGGDKLFVDYAGDTVPVIVDRLTGQVRAAQIFVAVMGASNFTYAEASWTQALADWIGAHTRAFAALGGVPKLLVPDNTKVAVIKACLYEPQVIAGAGTVSEAEIAIEKSIDVARRQNAKSWELRAAMSLARLRRQQGRPQEAAALLAPIYAWLPKASTPPISKEAKTLLDKLTEPAIAAEG
jgi:hypothetical protein